MCMNEVHFGSRWPLSFTAVLRAKVGDHRLQRNMRCTLIDQVPVLCRRLTADIYAYGKTTIAQVQTGR
ncbi:hypothetical protein F5887DRAFT_539443 [Amanita rubescens]|nr:hypothetical protein F5887DRAFT_539443 [Amanita rubescens]